VTGGVHTSAQRLLMMPRANSARGARTLIAGLQAAFAANCFNKEVSKITKMAGIGLKPPT
jgi:hypothetical protein